jgi:hypothetical protein
MPTTTQVQPVAASKRKFVEAFEPPVSTDSNLPNSNMAKAGNDEIPILKLDLDGDVIMAAGRKKWLVSSKVLGMASPVFKRMFASDFQEGTRVRNGATPTITLEEDHEKAMDYLFHILHHQTDHVPLSIPWNGMSSMAETCDKYDCVRALKSWITIWMKDLEEMMVKNKAPPGEFIFSTYFLDRDNFPKLAGIAVPFISVMSLDTWKSSPRLSRLPDTIAGLSSGYSR